MDEINDSNESQERAAMEVALSTRYIRVVLASSFHFGVTYSYGTGGVVASNGYILKRIKTCYKVAQKNITTCS